MATVSASLKIFDQVSSSLATVNSAMNTTIQNAERLQRGLQGQISIRFVVDQSEALQQALHLRAQIEAQLGQIIMRVRIEMPAQITVLFLNLQRLVERLIMVVRELRRTSNNNNEDLAAALERIRRLEQQILDLQNRVNDRIRGAGRDSGGFLSNLKSIAATYLTIAGAKKLFDATVGAAFQQSKMEDMFKARTGDDAVGEAMFDKFKSNALKAGQDVKKSLTGVLSFFSITKNTDHLEKLMSISERMAAFDTTGQGVEGATFSVKEAMSGDVQSLAERFNMSKSQIKATGLIEMGKKGDIEGFIAAFDKLLVMQSMGQAAFDKMMSSPAKQAEVLGNNLKSAMADAGDAAVVGLMPLITMLNTAFKEGKFQPFFDGLSRGLSIFATVATGSGQFILKHMDLIRNVLIAIGLVVGALAIQWVVSWAIAAWPVFAVIAGIALLITILNRLGIKGDQIVGFVAGLFFGLFAFVWNNVAFLWNKLIIFAEFFSNLFIDPVYAVKKLFFDLVKEVVGYFGSMMNTMIDGLNFVIAKVNKIPGIKNIDLIGHVEDGFLDKYKPKSDKAVVDFDKYKMEYKDVTATAIDGYNKGKGAFDQAADSFKEFDFSKWNKQADIDRVNTVGKIEDTVDISNEDLKVMRELAEMKSIQYYVSLTPTVQVTTGDINQNADADELVRKIEKSMEQQMSISTEDVYAGL